MYRLFSDQTSANCYKVRLLAAHLGLALALVDVDIVRGESRTPDFLMMNPNGQVPLLVLPGGQMLAESNAMLLYLAEGTPLSPTGRLERAHVAQWMFFEQNAIVPNLARARFWLSQVKGGRALKANLIDEWMERGYDGLGVLDRHLADGGFVAGPRFTVADIALYAHIHLAEEGDFDLKPFRHVGAWLARVAAEPAHVDMAWRPAAERVSEPA